jgi:hypothetical protein
MPQLRPGDHDAVLNGTRIHYSARCVQVTALCGYTGGVLWIGAADVPGSISMIAAPGSAPGRLWNRM